MSSLILSSRMEPFVFWLSTVLISCHRIGMPYHSCLLVYGAVFAAFSKCSPGVDIAWSHTCFTGSFPFALTDYLGASAIARLRTAVSCGASWPSVVGDAPAS